MKYTVQWLLLIVLVLNTAGCGSFVAHSLVRAPNRYPTWFDSWAPVTLAFDPKLLTNFVAQYAEIGPPAARLRYRVVEPADYRVQVTVTNWVEDERKEFEFSIKAKVPAETNQWTAAPRGTVILLHGFGLAQFSMLPWALCLAQDGWRSVLVDLRGHGKSTGREIYYGIRETNDLSELLDALASRGQLAGPVAVVGESYGASLALRWKTVEPRVHAVVAIAPYASLSNAVMNVRSEYANWVPKGMVRSGVKDLPGVLGVQAGELDTTTVMERRPVKAMFVAGADDKIAPVSEVEELRALALPGSELIVVPDATHESLTYYFKDLRQPVLAWLDGGRG